jgi:hypothetical protein
LFSTIVCGTKGQLHRQLVFSDEDKAAKELGQRILGLACL